MINQPKHYKSISLFIVFSVLIAMIDALFVWINYSSAQFVLSKTILDKNYVHEGVFKYYIKNRLNDLEKLSNLLSVDKSINQELDLLNLNLSQNNEYEIKKQFPRLKNKVQASYKNLYKNKYINNLKYYVESLDESLIYMNEDYKKDRHKNYLVKLALQHKKTFSGYHIVDDNIFLTSVSPVFYENKNNRTVFLGVIEISQSLDETLLFVNHLNNSSGALIAYSNDQYQLLNSYHRDISLVNIFDYAIDSALNNMVNEFVFQNHNLTTYGFNLNHMQNYYQDNLNAYAVFWIDITEEKQQFFDDLRINILYAMVGFILIELVFYIILKTHIKYKMMEHHASTDKLTQIPNRAAFDQKLAEEMSRNKRGNSALSVLLCDIDFFKQYNDTYGHQKGDECLQQVAKVMSQSIHRAGDFVARYGGEEFVFILPNCNQRSAKKIAETVRKNIQKAKIRHEKSSVSQYVSLSLGIASAHYNEIISGPDLVKKADAKLYLAKENGRNRSEV